MLDCVAKEKTWRLAKWLWLNLRENQDEPKAGLEGHSGPKIH